MRYSLSVIVVRILSQSSVVEAPGEVVDRVGLVLDGAGDDLRIEVVVEEVIQVALDR